MNLGYNNEFYYKLLLSIRSRYIPNNNNVTRVASRGHSPLSLWWIVVGQMSIVFVVVLWKVYFLKILEYLNARRHTWFLSNNNKSRTGAHRQHKHVFSRSEDPTKLCKTALTLGSLIHPTQLCVHLSHLCRSHATPRSYGPPPPSSTWLFTLYPTQSKKCPRF